MSWLGQGFSRDSIKSLSEAYQEVKGNVEQVDELYKGKHGQSEKEYQDSRSDGGKMVSGDSKYSGAAYSSRGIKNTGPNPAGGSKKPQAQGRMTSGARADLEYRKANLKKEELEELEEIIDEYSVSVKDGLELEEGKKKCKEGYKYDSKKKKCVKKKKKSSSSKSSKTTVIVKRGGGGYYGGMYPGYGSGGGNSGGDNGGDGETESNGGGGGGDGGGGGE